MFAGWPGNNDRWTQKQEVSVYRFCSLILFASITFLASPVLIDAQKPHTNETVGRSNSLKKSLSEDNKNTRGSTHKAFTERDAMRLKDPWALNNIGVDLVEAAQFNDAMRVFKEAIKIAPNMAGLHINLSTVYEQLGQLDESLRSA